MRGSTKYLVPRIAIATIAVALCLVQWLIGEVPVWFFAFPMNLLVGALWLAVVCEGYRHRATSATVHYLLSAEATYIALTLAATAAGVLGLHSSPATTSWLTAGTTLYILTVLTLVILRGWRNRHGIRWRFLVTHCGLWIALFAMFFGAPDKHILRMQINCIPSREAIDEQNRSSFLDYEMSLKNFVVEESESGSPKRFCATIVVDDKVVDIEVNKPYSHRYGEDIYLVSYAPEGCVVQIVQEPWRAVTLSGVALLLLGALLLFMKGFKRDEQ